MPLCVWQLDRDLCEVLMCLVESSLRIFKGQVSLLFRRRENSYRVILCLEGVGCQSDYDLFLRLVKKSSNIWDWMTRIFHVKRIGVKLEFKICLTQPLIGFLFWLASNCCFTRLNEVMAVFEPDSNCLWLNQWSGILSNLQSALVFRAEAQWIVWESGTIFTQALLPVLIVLNLALSVALLQHVISFLVWFNACTAFYITLCTWIILCKDIAAKIRC